MTDSEVAFCAIANPSQRPDHLSNGSGVVACDSDGVSLGMDVEEGE